MSALKEVPRNYPLKERRNESMHLVTKLACVFTSQACQSQFFPKRGLGFPKTASPTQYLPFHQDPTPIHRRLVYKSPDFNLSRKPCGVKRH